MQRRKIRAFCGVQGSGKSFSTARLIMTKGYKAFAFADALRDVAFKAIGIPYKEGMQKYEELKQTELINGLNFRNILENIGSAVRRYDEDFWAKTVITLIKECTDNVCISDLRYPNEYFVLREFAKRNSIDFKLVFCDYHSDRYQDDNPHESAALANYLKSLGYKDQQYVLEEDIKKFVTEKRKYE